eukprot:UN07863
MAPTQSTFIVICIAFTFSIFAALSDPPPPILPNGFTVSGGALYGTIWPNGSIILTGNTTFTEYYDYDNKRMRMDYGDGNGDSEMCITYPGKECHLYFDQSGALYVYYPYHDFCCLGCPPGQYCTVIKPDWIANGNYDGTQIVNNRLCNVWSEYGVTSWDYWAQDNDTVPCALWMENKVIDHEYFNKTYDPDSYVVAQPNPHFFELPSNCQNNPKSCHK